jgi:hypothetical protein
MEGEADTIIWKIPYTNIVVTAGEMGKFTPNNYKNCAVVANGCRGLCSCGLLSPDSLNGHPAVRERLRIAIILA